MNNYFFTSDTHFTHDNLRQHYPARAAFHSVDELDERMIETWNERIRPKDKVWHIGDFGGWDIAKTAKIAHRLNGSIELVPGNHDKKALKDPKFVSAFAKIHPYSYAEISVEGQQIVLCHFPIWEWMQLHRGWWHLHGHVHGKPTGIPGKILDVGVDGHDLLPWSFEQVQRYMEKRPVRMHHKPVED